MHVSTFGFVTCAAAGLIAISANSASAADSVNWSTGLLTVTGSSNSASWNSATAVDTGYPQYDYQYEITEVELETAFGGWQSALAYLGSDAFGNGSFGALPAELLSDSIDDLGVSGNILVYVDANGIGHLNLSDFSFSDMVIGARVSMDITVTPVPEPASFGLLAAAGGLLLSRRRVSRL